MHILRIPLCASKSRQEPVWGTLTKWYNYKDMIQIDKQLIRELFDKAVVSERKRMNFDLRTSPDDGGQRMLNALMPGTVVPLHRHPHSR